MAFTLVDTVTATDTLKDGMDHINANFNLLASNAGAAEIKCASPWTGQTIQSVLTTIYNYYPTYVALATTYGATLIGYNDLGNLYIDATTVQGALNAIDNALTATATATQLADITHDINTTGKYQGKQVFNTTSNEPVWAQGAAAGDDWTTVIIAGSITPA